MGYPNGWMVYNGTSENKMDDLGVPYFGHPPSISGRRFCGFHNWGYPAGWFIREYPKIKWVITRGTPIYGNPQVVVICSFHVLSIVFGGARDAISMSKSINLLETIRHYIRHESYKS